MEVRAPVYCVVVSTVILLVNSGPIRCLMEQGPVPKSRNSKGVGVALCVYVS